MAKTGRLELRVSVELLERVDAARGDVSRTRFVERALERAVGGPSASRVLPSPERLNEMADESAAVARLSRPVPGVRRASSVAMDRQAKLNAARKK